VWESLAQDGKHALDNPSLPLLQNPGDVLKELPPDFESIGNQVDWVRALNSGAIEPRSQIYPDTTVNELNLDIIMDATGEMPLVRFPHKAHTDWLDCENCHDKIFKEKAGGNPVNMFAILAGEYCGRCHGAVSFPLTECRRCHSVSRSTFTGQPGAQPGPGRVFPPVKEQKVVR
jgi:c(7)-type cytochrome triheme protein